VAGHAVQTIRRRLRGKTADLQNSGDSIPEYCGHVGWLQEINQSINQFYF